LHRVIHKCVDNFMRQKYFLKSSAEVLQVRTRFHNIFETTEDKLMNGKFLNG